MIINTNKSNYIDNSGNTYDDRHNRYFAAALINNYFNDDCSITIDDRYDASDISVTHNNITYHCDVKSCNFPSNTKLEIGYNLYQHKEYLNSNIENIRILMFYTDALLVYDIKNNNFKTNTFTRMCNDRSKGKGIREFIQLNNNQPTTKINYYIPTLRNVKLDENNLVQLGDIDYVLQNGSYDH